MDAATLGVLHDVTLLVWVALLFGVAAYKAVRELRPAACWNWGGRNWRGSALTFCLHGRRLIWPDGRKPIFSSTNLKPQSETDISHAVRVLTAESDALAQLARSIDQNFADAVSAIHAMKTAERGSGRLIVAGIGQSGHVARKIAATLASTGTPAYYVHPGEASHGDMGMITPKDVVLMLSNSDQEELCLRCPHRNP